MRSIFFTLSIFLTIAVLIYAQQSLVLSKPDDPVAELSAKVLREAYNQLGIEMQTKTFPAEWALLTSNNEDVDGEVNRMNGVENTYSNLLLVPVAINILDGVVFTKDVNISVMGWDSLKEFNIGIRRGTKFAEQGTNGMNVETADNNFHLFRKLDAGRYDVVITSRIEGLSQLRQLQLTGIHLLEPPLLTLNLYNYLHKKRAALLPEITRVLYEMEADGRIQEIRQQVITEFRH